jgi:hypothetical protein
MVPALSMEPNGAHTASENIPAIKSGILATPGTIPAIWIWHANTHVLEEGASGVICKGDGAAGAASTRGAADAVQVGGQSRGRVIVDHHIYPQNVQPTRRHVGCQQERRLALPPRTNIQPAEDSNHNCAAGSYYIETLMPCLLQENLTSRIGRVHMTNKIRETPPAGWTLSEGLMILSPF